MNTIYTIGFDIGSTTAKVAVLDNVGKLFFSDYRRHNTRINETCISIFQEIQKQLGNCSFNLKITGSAGMGISERYEIPFIQEVIASTNVIKKYYKEIKTLIDIGGEDSKMIFFHNDKAPDIRMNGSCAGGTGAFIDQMASIMNVPITKLNELAQRHKKIYPIASRCGVFAKTDVHNLLSRKVPHEDIAASIFHAVSIQAINTLSRGFDINRQIMLSGGPFTFLSELRKIFIKNIKIQDTDIILSENSALLPAIGAALCREKNNKTWQPEEIIKELKKIPTKSNSPQNRLMPLFKNNNEFETWNKQRISHHVKKVSLADYKSENTFLGIDSGSTTTKIVLIGENNELLFNHYEHNGGNTIEALKKGLNKLNAAIIDKNSSIAYTAVTGYGEDLVKATFGIDLGMVETIAHFNAAQFFNSQVSFIIDIGGQDMKAIFVENNSISRIELNEACSSGCGSFIETFGQSLGYKIADFALKACQSNAPCDLGTRCTVFMNSKVKQSLRENAGVDDIAAGLSYSVIKNALFKVLQLNNTEVLGTQIMIQGGTFKNPSVHKAIEDLTGQKALCTNIPELMGAFGAAITAKETYKKIQDAIPDNTKIISEEATCPTPEQKPPKKVITKFIGVDNLDQKLNYSTRQMLCKACQNNCTITKYRFDNKNNFYSGNKCEKVFSNQGNKTTKGETIFDYKYDLLFNRKQTQSNAKFRIGIPRILNQYETYPFWHTLLTRCGFEVVLSSPSSMSVYEKGQGTVMSDSICFPAKLVHGHIIDLAERKVNRIFYPMAFYEKREKKEAENVFNCPIVSSYPDVIRSSMNPEKRYSIPFDSPAINFNDNKLLLKACTEYLKKLGISKISIQKAFNEGLAAYNEFRKQIAQKGLEIIEHARKNNRLLVVLAGRPYHTDTLINHRTPDILSSMGVDVISEDAVPAAKNETLDDLQIMSQWAYPNRIYQAAQWVAEQDEQVQFVQLNSFGCGPDAISIDENNEILRSKGKNNTLIRVDEISSTGSVRLRLRSMVESLKIKQKQQSGNHYTRQTTAVFEEKDKHRTILSPYFGQMYAAYIPPVFKVAGYNLVNLPKPDKKSVEYGLKYTNNEICYPATIIVGDVIKALKSGKYKKDEIAVAFSQTGGQCRASTYLALIRKGMVAAGFEDVPVISVNPQGEKLNPQPGFKIEWSKILGIAFTVTLYADSLAKMYYASIVREKNKGQTLQIYEEYTKFIEPFILKKDIKGIMLLLSKAVKDFNAIETHERHFPKIGFVGEIYVKYNSFGHQFITDWLINKGIEVIVPPLLEFFIQEFVNIPVNKKLNLSKKANSDYLVFFLEKLAQKHINKANRILKNYKHYQPFHNIKTMAQKAEKILSLANQFGEGWLIPAEIAAFADEGVKNIVSVQPFGCIANQVVAKGVEKRIRDLYPDMNLLFLDFDDGTSEVNILNRLHFMVKNVFEGEKINQ